VVLPFPDPEPKCPECRGKTTAMLRPLIRKGEIDTELPKPSEIRQYVLDQLGNMPALF